MNAYKISWYSPAGLQRAHQTLFTRKYGHNLAALLHNLPISSFSLHLIYSQEFSQHFWQQHGSLSALSPGPGCLLCEMVQISGAVAIRCVC